MIGIGKLLLLVCDLQTASQGIIDEAIINRGAAWIDALEIEFPFAHRMLMSALYEEPEDVLDALAKYDPELKRLKTNPNALEYVRRLQAKIRGRRDD